MKTDRTRKSPLAGKSESELKEIRRKAAESRKARSKIKARFSVMKAIRYKCIDCCAGSWKDVELCEIKECSLWEYRFGKRPNKEMVEAVQGVTVHGRDI